MKRKFLKNVLLVAVSVVLTAALVIGGTLAYLTDRDQKVNVFTVGNVDIELNETFEQGAELLPGKNIEKVVSITNTGKNDAYVWVTIAIPSALDNENDASQNVIHFNYGDESLGEGKWTWTDENDEWNIGTQEIDGIEYNVYAVLYQSVLKPGETTPDVMNNVYLDVHVDITPEGDLYWVNNGEVKNLNWNVNVQGNPMFYVAAYAIQADNLVNNVYDAFAAYSDQWGDNGGVKYDVPTATFVSTADELVAALAKGGDVALAKNITLTKTLEFAEGVTATIDLNGKTLTGSILAPNANLTVTNGTIENTNSSVSAIEINAGTLDLENVNISSARHAVRIDGAVEATINGGTYKAAAYNGTGTYHTVNVSGKANVTINGGTFVGPKGTTADSGSAVIAQKGSTVTINGGNFSGGKNNTLSGAGNLTVMGGTFDQDPSAYVNGSEVVKNGNNSWTVKPYEVSDADELTAALEKGQNVVLANDITVDKWIMFSETLSVANGNIITVKMDGLTIYGNGHTLTVNSIESAGNGNRLFHNASNLNIYDLTIKYAEGLAGGISLKSGTISNVNFVGGKESILPGTGDVRIENCTFASNSTSIYFDSARDNLTVTGCTFNNAADANVILLRGTVEFTNNTVNSGRTVNIVSGSPVVTGNNFNNVRLKVYAAATATVSNNTINILEFEDNATTYSSNFADNTLSDAAQAALDAAVTKN